MVSALAAKGFAYLCLAFAALQLSTFLDLQCGVATMTCGEAPLLHSAAEVLPPLAALGVLFVAVALTYRSYVMTSHVVAAAAVAGAGNGRRSISGLVMFALCVSAGTIEFIVFGQAGGGAAPAEDHSAQARALGLAALRALPAAATVTFFLGMMLIIVAHVRAGGEGGGGAVAAGDGPMQGLLRFLAKVAAGAASALVVLMAMALTLQGAKY